MKPYHESASQIKSDLRNLEHLYHERETLAGERERAREERATISDDLLDAHNDASQIAKLAKSLEEKDRDIRKLDAILQALDRRALTAEDQFHELIPKACHTFTRLLIHFKTLIHERQVQILEALIHPSLRLQFQPQVEILADATCEAVDAHAIRIPSGNVWSLTRQLTPEARHETLSFVRQTAIALTDKADELLVELAKLGEPSKTALPEFVLGELPEPIREQPSIPLVLEEMWQSQQEREHVMRLCQDAGKDFKTLSDSDKMVLQNSLLLYRRQLANHGVKLGHTFWDGSQS